MVAGLAAGGMAHHLEIRTDRDCVFLDLGDRTPGDDGQWRFTRKDGAQTTRRLSH